MIYTRTGDKGTTSLIGGKRVRKDDLRVDVYGSVDELNCCIGVAVELINNTQYRDQLLRIQSLLFNVESLIACEDATLTQTLPQIEERHITELEQKIDSINYMLPVVTQFILPGGSPLAASLNVARAVCRRVERLCVKFDTDEQNLDNRILRFINRLSDYLFVLSRKEIYDNGKQERYWNKDV